MIFLYKLKDAICLLGAMRVSNVYKIWWKTFLAFCFSFWSLFSESQKSSILTKQVLFLHWLCGSICSKLSLPFVFKSSIVLSAAAHLSVAFDMCQEIWLSNWSRLPIKNMNEVTSDCSGRSRGCNVRGQDNNSWTPASLVLRQWNKHWIKH